MWEEVSSITAVIALLYSIFVNRKTNNLKEKYDQQQKRMALIEHEETIERDRFNKELSRITSSESVTPYFALDLHSEDIQIKNDRTELGLRLKNVGLATAVNIQIAAKKEIGTENIYVSTRNGTKVGIVNYLDKEAAMVSEQISFKIGTKRHDQFADNFWFKLSFFDVAGREYIQEFRFLYGNVFTPNNYTLNNTSYRPVMVKDIVE